MQRKATGAVTRGEQMLALRRARMKASPPFLRGGFRPFFFGGAIWAVVAISLWMANFWLHLPLPTTFEPVGWHRHEMLFGFIGAILAGYLLTSVANWTGGLPVAGRELLLLFLLWCAGRVAVLTSAWIGPWPAAMIDIGFYLVLALSIGREVFAARKRDFSMLAPLLLLAVANAVDHAEAAGLLAARDIGIHAGIGLVVLFISLVGGRLVPSFTRNWLAKQQIRNHLPVQPDGFDRVVVLVTALALACWVLVPTLAPAPLLVAALGQALRLWRWRGWRAWRAPTVLILHLGYAWIPLGLLLLAGATLGVSPPLSVALHALTAGAMATMVLAVMTRTLLNQTGRPWARHTALIFVGVMVGALLRVVAPLVPGFGSIGLLLAALFWGGAFLLFAVSYGRVFFAPRADDPFG